jgi:uncharacterized membrane protein
VITATRAGIVIGAVLALSWIILGFWACLFVAAAMVVGGLIGRILEGKLDVASLVDVFRGKRSSS